MSDVYNRLRPKVFISCGQHTEEERSIARQIAYELSKLGFEPYVALIEQTVEGLKNISHKLVGMLVQAKRIVERCYGDPDRSVAVSPKQTESWSPLHQLETLNKFQLAIAEPFGMGLNPDPTELISVRFVELDSVALDKVDVRPDSSHYYALMEKVYVRRDGESREMSGPNLAAWWARRIAGEIEGT